MNNIYIPEANDIIWLSFDPTLGSEQSGRRPALVLSEKVFNQNGMLLVCPITSKVKNLRFEVELSNCDQISGAILSSQVKCLDWRPRSPEYIEKCPPLEVVKTKLKIALLIGIDSSITSLIG